MAKRVCEASRRRAESAERARLIGLLEWAPEDGTAAGRYVATTGELWQTAVERGLLVP